MCPLLTRRTGPLKNVRKIAYFTEKAHGFIGKHKITEILLLGSVLHFGHTSPFIKFCFYQQ